MQIKELFRLILGEELGEVYRDVSLAQHTTWRIGGPADLFYQPEDLPACARVLSIAYSLGIPVTFLGAGSNVLVADEGLRGLVVYTKKLNRITWGPRIRAQAGAALASLSQQAGQEGLRGLEFACGIPGSVGGAAIMNAGAYGAYMSDVVTKISTLTLKGETKSYGIKELGYGYRTSQLKGKPELVVEVEFNLQPGDAQESRRLMESYLQLRREKHPLHLPNAGSVFRNTPQGPAGRLIEEAGLKGRRVGDAQVSEQHANFIVNLNKAKAKDVRQLIREVQQEVFRKKSVWLENEVVFLGF